MPHRAHPDSGIRSAGQRQPRVGDGIARHGGEIDAHQPRRQIAGLDMRDVQQIVGQPPLALDVLVGAWPRAGYTRATSGRRSGDVSRASGRVNQNVDPSPGALSTPTRPP